jgi:hypothetical protein
MRSSATLAACAVALLAMGPFLALAPAAEAATYQVGPGKTYAQLTELPPLAPGDVVEVDGDFTYDAVILDSAGEVGAPIRYTGIPVNGNRPRIDGGFNTVEIQGSYTVFEGFEITGGSARCIYHHAHEVTIRDTVVHNCPAQGILGGDYQTGSLTLEHVEVYACGGGTYDHQIYMATNEADYPGAVFRMQHCYVHDANGGNSVKSRAERNEIYYNWIEGGFYHELELIGPDGSPDLYREDSDVACNVLRKTGGNDDFFVVRVGGDGTGETNGRYRFFHNTIIVSDALNAAAVWRLFEGLESIEMHNNLLLRASVSDGLNLYRDTEAVWVGGEVIVGENNWVLAGSMNVPAGWTGTLEGTDPLLDPATMKPTETSPLRDAAAPSPASAPGHELPNPLTACLYHPPLHTLVAPGGASRRPEVGAVDIGAFEYGDGPPASGGAGGGGAGGDSTGTAGAGGAGSGGGGGAPPGAGGGPGVTPGSDDSGCSCRTVGARGGDPGASDPGALLLAASLLGLAWRRREPQPGRSRARPRRPST